MYESESEVLSRVRLLATPWTVVYQALRLWDFPGKSASVGCHFLLQGDLPDPGIEPGSPALEADALISEPPGKQQRPNPGPLHWEHGVLTPGPPGKSLECHFTRFNPVVSWHQPV